MNTVEPLSPVPLDLNYLAPVAWFININSFPEVIIDPEQLFKKSSLLNRCRIMGANGAILLTVPVQGGRGTKKKFRDVKISYEERWQQVHWNSICSAYRKSSFFEYYEDLFSPFYEMRTEYLIELNFNLFLIISRILSISTKILLQQEGDIQEKTTYRQQNETANKGDQIVPYYQVFQHKYGFVENLSIIDLIFNKGPDAGNYLLQRQ